ncbi:UNKNOWN [Stylonychia lemnae]|uniref:Uncharacterized protein n=1 Tax=Stylonychia lemnae TaxID=5949 RepID=A0A078AA90_STYLE|nr:UNKNOWN [Stylonychia lemnae]|eukprot:CDW79175.1 UNKNOWN [Stylonychia lemnae]
MVHKDDDESFEYAMTHFKLALAQDFAPKLFVVERNSSLRAAIQKILVKVSKQSILTIRPITLNNGLVIL